SKPEVHGCDCNRDRNPISDDPERPGISGVALIDEPAHRAALAGGEPSVEQGAFAATRTAPPDAMLQGFPRGRGLISVRGRVCLSHGAIKGDTRTGPVVRPEAL